MYDTSFSSFSLEFVDVAIPRPVNGPFHFLPEKKKASHSCEITLKFLFKRERERESFFFRENEISPNQLDFFLSFFTSVT